MARTFLPTAEVALDIDGHVHSVPAFRPERFHGGQNVSLVDLVEPCFAVNLMVADDGMDPENTAGAMQMSVGQSVPADRTRFVLTLEDGAEYPRFQLLESETGEAVPDEISVAVLHIESVDTHI